jgi:CheY-like chemotaxis protein
VTEGDLSDAAKSYWLLIVEDDPNHVMLMESVFSGCDGHVHISVTRSAEEAMSYLQGSWPDADYGRAKMPDVIVLDIGMPGIGGCGFLEWYNRQPRFAKIPVVVFTSQSAADVAERCFSLGANEFKEKSGDFSELMPVVHKVLGR